MGKVELLNERCFGCGACRSVAPENFTCNDEGRTTMISNEATNEAIEASEICPASAIIIEENCECENCNCTDSTECNCEHDCTCKDNCNCTTEDNCGCISECNSVDECNCSDNCSCGCKVKE